MDRAIDGQMFRTFVLFRPILWLGRNIMTISERALARCSDCLPERVVRVFVPARVCACVCVDKN